MWSRTCLCRLCLGGEPLNDRVVMNGSSDMRSTNTIKKLITAAVMLIAPPALILPACTSDVAPEDTTQAPGPDGGDGQGDDGEGICLLNNCKTDLECQGCSDGRTTCKVEENRCVACDPVSGKGCGEGEQCSPYGLCVPEGLTCDSDAEGNPTVKCNSNADCKACSPMHQVCDPATNSCQACTATNTQHCLQSDICIDKSGDGHPESCSPKCPSSCDADNDCSQCGGPGNEAHACNAHKCAECSDTYPCPAGLECNSGSCVPQCGIPGPTAGDCTSDEDCAFCGDPNSPDKWACKKPINSNGPNDHGTCGPDAAGCSDLGNSVAVLPAPYDQVTNACSDDNDCNGVGITYNVGAMVKKLVGKDEINLGFKKVKIQDANVQYAMPKCADIDITENISCGVCVPCEVDSDCQPIDLDNVMSDLFKGDPLAQIAGSMLIDLLYGNTPDHHLNFFCQPVAAGYGACVPCSNPLQACGTSNNNNNMGGGNNNGGANCAHGLCDQGAALDPNCDSCVTNVCNQDSFCCTNSWDNLCVDQAKKLCGANDCGGGGGGGCDHSECSSGGKLDKSCSTCATEVCNQDAYCCDNQWDSICVNLAKNTASCGC